MKEKYKKIIIALVILILIVVILFAFRNLRVEDKNEVKQNQEFEDLKNETRSTRR